MAGPTTFTVPEICRALHVEPTPKLTWAVGAKARTAYRRIYKADPPKGLRRKTTGSGSHCFAVYPADMRPIIEQIVKHESGDPEIQGTLL